MSILSLVMFLGALSFLYFVIRQINKNAILFEQAFMWLLIALALILISLFEGIPIWFAQALGFGLTSNFILSASIFFLLGTVFLHAVTISRQKEQIKQLVQELSISQKKWQEKEAKSGD